MNIAEKIYQEARRLPEPLSQEVLDFIEYLEAKHGLADATIETLKQSQQPVMVSIWGNDEDQVWDDW